MPAVVDPPQRRARDGRAQDRTDALRILFGVDRAAQNQCERDKADRGDVGAVIESRRTRN